MVTDDLLREYREALEAKYRAVVDVKVLEMKLRLASAPATEPTVMLDCPQKHTANSREQFIEIHRDKFESEDLEFLSVLERSPAEVSDYLGGEPGPKQVKNLIDSGFYRPGPSDKPGVRRTVDTLSVVEKVLSIQWQNPSEENPASLR